MHRYLGNRTRYVPNYGTNLPLMINRKLHMCLRSATRSMTLEWIHWS